MLKLETQSDYKTMADIALSYSYKSHNGDIELKVNILLAKTTFPHSLSSLCGAKTVLTWTRSITGINIS